VWVDGVVGGGRPVTMAAGCTRSARNGSRGPVSVQRPRIVKLASVKIVPGFLSFRRQRPRPLRMGLRCGRSFCLRSPPLAE